LLAHIPARLRPFVTARLDGMGLREMSTMHQLSERTVRRRLAEARKYVAA
jgi:DNA-directed RNA polymerase specialized sigma24 family protein